VKEGANPEMDGLRKLVSGRLRAQAAGPHPDPDVLAAFAENALLDTERAHLLQHLGACNDCREILYLAAPDSGDAQRVLSFQPKRSTWLVFRWGTLAATVVIVGAAVVARHPLFHARSQSPAAVKAPVSTYAKVAEEKIPAEAEKMRDALRTQPPTPAPSPGIKERPEAKHMTARPQARMDFDESGQVRVSAGVVADQGKKSSADDLVVTGRNVVSLTAPGASAAKPVSPPAVAGMLAKDNNENKADYANVNQLAREKAARGNLGGTILDASGAAVGNAKVTASGPIGVQTAASDSDGRFSFNSLTPGAYSIKAEANGFKPTEINQVAVLDNKTSKIGVRLEVGTTSETVEVTAAAPAADQGAGAAAGLQVETTNGVVLAQKQASSQGLQKAVATNSPQRAKASRSAMPAPQWTLSAEGSVQRSSDLGKSWQKVTVLGGTTFRALCAVGTHVWVGGNAGTLYHSVDSGQSWTQVIPAANEKLTADVTRIEFSDPANGSVSTVNGEVWSTSDGGQSWRRK
jgi:hypothetical protein